MDSDKRSARVERLEVVDTGRRRRWSEDEKLKIVLESLQAPRQVAATARRYGISRSLLLRWRRSFRPEPTDTSVQPIGFAPAMVVPESGAAPGPVRSAGNVRNPMFNRMRQPSRGGTSRMTRECQVRFCEGLGVKFPGPTRQISTCRRDNGSTRRRGLGC